MRIAERVALEVSQRLGILRAPPFAYSTTNDAGPYPGAAGLRRKTLHRSINELLGVWEASGIREFLIISAHRYEPHLEALLMALTRKAVSSIYDLYQVDVSDLLEGNPEHEHAGELETSLMLHLAPELVRSDKIQDFVPTGQTLRKYTRRRAPTPPMKSEGTLGAPSLATAGKGKAIFDRYVAALSATVSRPSNRASTEG